MTRRHAGYRFNVTCLDCGAAVRHRASDIDPRSMLASADCVVCGAEWDIDVVMSRRTTSHAAPLVDPIDDWLACPHCGKEHAGLTPYRDHVATHHHELLETAI